MDGENETFNRPGDEGDEVEAHKFEPEDELDEFDTPADDDEDVEAHKF
jgi:hypothetical protein